MRTPLGLLVLCAALGAAGPAGASTELRAGRIVAETVQIADGMRAGVQTQADPANRFPIRIVKDIVLVDVRVNDSKPLTFILDTGFGQDVIDLKTAKRLGLELHDIGLQIRGPGAETPNILIASGVRTSLSETVSWRGTLQALPLEHLTETLGERVHGVLGAPIFRQYVVEIDYPRATLHLWQPEGYRPLPGAAELPITLRGERPRAAVVLETPEGQRLAATLLLDTGANVGVALATSYREWPLDSGSGATTTAQAIGGGLKFRSVGFTRVHWGELEIPDVQVQHGYEARERQLDGLLGARALSRFRIALDYARGRTYVWKEQSPE